MQWISTLSPVQSGGPFSSTPNMTAVDGAINFLARDGRYEDEKPYYLKFPPPAGFARDNLVYDLQVKQVEDVRGREDGFSVAANGFAVMQLDEELAYDEYDDRSKVESVYCRQVAQGVRKLLGASRVQVFEHVVCIRARLAIVRDTVPQTL